MEKRILKPYHGIIFFVIIVLALMFPGAYMQTYWGVSGLIATEVMFLLLAVLYAVILKADLKKVFPIKKPKIIAIMGTVMLWCGTLLIVMTLTSFLLCLFPEQMLATSQGLNEFFSQMPVFVQILVVAVLPAICEEAAHRGVIQNSFMPIPNKWIVIIGVGVLFGFNHLSIWRFIPTAVLGIALAYVLYETGNIVYSMLFHFLNNAFSVASTSSATVSTTDALAELQNIPELAELGIDLVNGNGFWIVSLGAFMMISCVTPFLLCLSSYLIRLGKEDTKDVTLFPRRYKGVFIGVLVGLTALLLIVGFAVCAIGMIMMLG